MGLRQDFSWRAKAKFLKLIYELLPINFISKHKCLCYVKIANIS